MIEKLRPYPEYKAIGVPWLRQIPAHWDISRSKRLFSARKELALPGDVQLSATQAYGVIPQSDFEARVGRRVVRISMHLEKRRHVEKDDFVISMRSFQGGLERAWASGAIRSSYVVLKAHAGVDVGYFTHLFKSHGYVRALQSTADFIRDGQDLNFSNFASVDLPLPPPAEQAIIGRFLYHAKRRTDRFIQAKRRLIALLNEQKQAIIHRAVTRGLDPSLPMRESGLPWLPLVPATWTVSRLKFEATHIIDCLHATPRYDKDGEFPAIRTADVEPGRLRLAQARHVSAEQFALWTARLEPQEGDILYSREGERFGMAATVPAKVRLCISQRMMVFRIRHHQDSEYLMWQLNCPHVYAQASSELIGSTSPHVNVEQIRNFQLVLPSYNEQRQIAIWIRSECKRIDSALARVEREVALIREYRTRLIADVVTGQLDVREAAAHLPPSDRDERAPADLEDDATDNDFDESEPE
jgi:type I restriction enzyme S subunit